MLSPNSRHGALSLRSNPVTAVVCLFLLLALTATTWAGSSTQATAQGDVVRLNVHRVHLDRLAADHAELSLEADIVPGIDAELKNLVLSSVHLDETPMYVTPVEGRFLLRPGVTLALPQVRVVVYYTDLPTPAVLDDMLAARHVRVSGDVRAQLQVSALSKLLMGDLHPVAALSLDQDVPFNRAAVDADVQAGVSLLGLAQRVLGATASVAEQLAGMRVDVQLNPASQAEREALLLVRTTFHTRGDAREQVCERLGFWLDASHILVPAEVLKPWAYTLPFAEAEAAHLDTLDEASVQTVMLPFALSGADALPRADLVLRNFVLEQQGSPKESRVVTPGRRQISLLQRNSPGNFAVLRLNESRAPGGSPMPLAELGVGTEIGTGAGTGTGTGTASGNLRLFRYRASPVVGLRALEWDVEGIGDTATSSAHMLPRPLDATYFGSPVLLNGAVVGMVTGETTWISLPPWRRVQAGDVHGKSAIEQYATDAEGKADHHPRNSADTEHGMAL